MAPRRRTNSFNENALLDIYQNVPAKISPVISSGETRAVIPVQTNENILSQALNNPQVLANDQSIMQKVADSTDSVVRLGLRSDSTSEDIVVYATKTNGLVQFSFTPPEVEDPGRAPASILGQNEMNVSLVPDIFSVVSKNPDRLNSYEEVLRNAMSLPGDVVRMNINSPTGENLTVYLDKRGRTPRFTVDDQAVIRAYNP